MIDIVEGNGRNLKNIRQIGTPAEEDKIYVENNAYERLHQEEFAEKRVFVLMGHTECLEKRYSTFVEAAIPVHDIDFSQSIPIWNNHAWSEVFREIKRVYEDAIIVGWALDIKGMQPKVTAELEAIHREQFGGAHQLFLLMDSLEQEEYFYLNRSNHLHKKDGFYIYYDAKNAQASEPMEVHLELPKTTLLPTAMPKPKERERSQARYREAMYNQKKETSGRKPSSYVMAAAVVLLIGIIGVGAYQQRLTLSSLEKLIATMGRKSQGVSTEATTEDILHELESSEDPEDSQAVETLQQNTVPVEEVPGGDILNQGTDTPDVSDASSLSDAPDAEAVSVQQTVSVVPQYYTVKKGDTLTGICRKIYGSSGLMEEIQRLNGLTEPDDIREGQQLVLP